MAEEESEPKFEIRMLALDANEGIAAGDVDGDGKTDLVAGRHWFRGGDWAPRPLRLIEDWNGYVQSNGDYLWDVDQDGRLDVV
ncbi:MAG: FG-GAP repeat protein, partial [Planctomycetota bacterium]